MEQTTNLAAALGRTVLHHAWDGHRGIVPVDSEFIAKVRDGAMVWYATDPAIESVYEFGQYKLVDGRPVWERKGVNGQVIGVQELADGELDAKVLRLVDPTILDAVLLDDAGLSPIERVKLAAKLSGMVRDLVAIPTGSTGAAALWRAKLAQAINALGVALGGDALAPIAEAAQPFVLGPPPSDDLPIPDESDAPAVAVYIATAIYRKTALAWRQRLASLAAESAERPALEKAIADAEAPQSVENAEKGMGGMLASAIASKSAPVLLGLLHSGNATSKAAFSRITGVKLPATDKGTKAAILGWTGMSAESYAAIQDEKRAAREKAERPEKIRSRVYYARMAAERVRVNLPDGTSTTGAAWIDGLIGNGQTLLAKNGNGPIKKWGLYQPETRRGVMIPNSVVAEYAKAVIEKLEFEKETEAVLDVVLEEIAPIEPHELDAHFLEGSPEA